jgi:hypothetical protein
MELCSTIFLKTYLGPTKHQRTAGWKLLVYGLYCVRIQNYSDTVNSLPY